MSGPVDAGSPPVPTHEQITALATAVRQGTLSETQREALAVLVEMAGVSVRAPAYASAPASAEAALALWTPVANALLTLLGSVRMGAMPAAGCGPCPR
jgi:hypothetical protein